MTLRRTGTPAAVVLSVSTLQAAYGENNSWQMANLFEPTPAQIEREHKQHVMIYHGLKDIDVNRAMDQHFDRIEAMMFTGTIVTDAAGEPLRDPGTDEVVVEDDGC
jgi:hypothetical protein